MPSGDAPDFELTQTHVEQVVSVLGALGGTNTRLVQFSTPFRIWSIEITVAMATSAAYNAGSLTKRARVQDDNNNVYASVLTTVQTASDKDNRNIVKRFDGVPVGGTPNFGFNLVVDANSPNESILVDCVLTYSVP
jgi:hypothetical protein